MNQTEESTQRFEFQFQLFNLNLIANGSLIAFALNTTGNLQHALLVSPLVSFTLFMFWVHHAIVNRIRSGPINEPPVPKIWQYMRRFTYSVAILANFAVVPIIAASLYTGDQYGVLKVIDTILIVVIVIQYVFWFYFQYLAEPV